ncbi:MAG: hypothetical protein QXR96_03625, partial [Candidatus Woesearchaeota archaeon]
VDDIILKLASSNEYNEKNIENYIIFKNLKDNLIVATNDADLKKKLKNLGIKIIYLKNKKIMEMQNVL